MEVGIATTCSDWSVDAATVARMVEDAGIPMLSFGEHTHIPASRETPYPGGSNSGDGALPPGYERSIDLFVTLTVAALATTKLKLGTGILQVVQRDPIVTAKAVASVDLLSGGRLVPITGSSWNIEEMRNHGTDPATRYELLEERVLAMREIWANDEATFHGQFVNFDRIWCWPKPAQNPMPIYIGGNSPGSRGAGAARRHRLVLAARSGHAGARGRLPRARGGGRRRDLGRRRRRAGSRPS